MPLDAIQGMARGLQCCGWHASHGARKYGCLMNIDDLAHNVQIHLHVPMITVNLTLICLLVEHYLHSSCNRKWNCSSTYKSSNMMLTQFSALKPNGRHMKVYLMLLVQSNGDSNFIEYAVIHEYVH